MRELSRGGGRRWGGGGERGRDGERGRVLMRPSYEELSSEDNLQKPYLFRKPESAHNGLVGEGPTDHE